MRLDWERIIKAMKGHLTGNLSSDFCGVSIDSRKIRPGELYFALSGDRFDGHDFALEALRKGAAASVVSRSRGLRITPRIEVNDPLTSLQQLAADVRKMVDIPVVGITGSHGKTTTKDMLSAILAQRGQTCATFQNLNGLIGVPLTILKLTREDRFLVIEVGISKPGEMKVLAEIVKPTEAIFTCVSKAHSEFLPTLLDIAHEKRNLLNWIQPGGHAILNADDPLIMSECRSGTIITFGLASGHYRGRIIGNDSTGIRFEVLEPDGSADMYHIAAFGRHNMVNALGAVTAARVLGLPHAEIQKGLDSFSPSPHRADVIRRPGLTVIDDSYNAAPNSMRCALQMLADFHCRGRRIAILGDMLELGTDTARLHRELGRDYLNTGIDILIAFGAEMVHMVDEVRRGGRPASFFGTADEALSQVKNILCRDDVILVKASRSMRAETIVNDLAGNDNH